MGSPSSVAKREITKQKAGHAHVFDDVLGASHHYGGYPVGFKMTCDQADRLMTDWAVGH